jgi:hypothetical protein
MVRLLRDFELLFNPVIYKYSAIDLKSDGFVVPVACIQ